MKRLRVIYDIEFPDNGTFEPKAGELFTYGGRNYEDILKNPKYAISEVAVRVGGGGLFGWPVKNLQVMDFSDDYAPPPAPEPEPEGSWYIRRALVEGTRFEGFRYTGEFRPITYEDIYENRYFVNLAGTLPSRCKVVTSTFRRWIMEKVDKNLTSNVFEIDLDKHEMPKEYYLKSKKIKLSVVDDKDAMWWSDAPKHSFTNGGSFGGLRIEVLKLEDGQEPPTEKPVPEEKAF